jgi:hypothetical protein
MIRKKERGAVRCFVEDDQQAGRLIGVPSESEKKRVEYVVDCIHIYIYIYLINNTVSKIR